MATYAIGDIHGCYEPLCQLLDTINFDPATDQLWFTGDLVNRGPNSLKTLRFVKSLGDNAITVLGNHDIHLLALYYGVRKPKDKDQTLSNILDADDAEDLIVWLQSNPLVHIENKTVLIHAGVHPHWSMTTLQSLKTELENTITNARSKKTMSKLYGNTTGAWSTAVDTEERTRYALNCLTRMRYCINNADPEYKCSETPGDQPDNLLPWFEFENKAFSDYTIIFGHWAALGYYQYNNVYALDSGCVWGNALTALRLEDKKIISVPCTN